MRKSSFRRSLIELLCLLCAIVLVAGGLYVAGQVIRKNRVNDENRSLAALYQRATEAPGEAYYIPPYATPTPAPEHLASDDEPENLSLKAPQTIAETIAGATAQPDAATQPTEAAETPLPAQTDAAQATAANEVLFDDATQPPELTAPGAASTEMPTEEPTEAPTGEPTEAPTEAPTEKPTEAPTEKPTEAPTEAPTEKPTEAPTEAPTEKPTEAPTKAPTEEPTEAPTEEPAETTDATPTPAPVEDLFDEETPGPTDEPAPEPTGEPTPDPDGALVLPLPTPGPVQDSFANLLELNDEVVAFLRIDNDHAWPVLQRANDNEYYLSHSFNKEEQPEGALFLDGMNRLTPRDDCLIVYGHNMKNGSMFGELDQYAKKTYARRHPIFDFDTIYENGDYVIVAAFTASVEEGAENYFDVRRFLLQGEALSAWFEQVQALSVWNDGVDVQDGDRLLMLVTCDYTYDDGRFILVARQVRPDEDEEALRAQVETMP